MQECLVRWIRNVAVAHDLHVYRTVLFQCHQAVLRSQYCNERSAHQKTIRTQVQQHKVDAKYVLQLSVLQKTNVYRFMKLIIVLSILFGFAIYIGIDAYDSPERFRSILGLVTLLGIGYCFSKHRSEVHIFQLCEKVPRVYKLSHFHFH